ncbi:hypothetical protein FBU30_010476 [Linnemannia zychae]|nr:hypothetical protein FBU30_010476 [Linnemannia zychae]
MSKEQHKIFNVPEIFRHIISFLSPESEIICLRVSRLFHSTVCPQIYSSITLVPVQDLRPSLATIKRYAHLVTALSFDSFISVDYLNVGFNNLKSLSISNDEDSHQYHQGTHDEITEALLKVIKENPNLCQWAFDSPYPPISPKVWEAIDSTAHRIANANVESTIQEKESSEIMTTTTTTTTSAATGSRLASVAIIPRGGPNIHNVHFSINKEKIKSNEVKSGIALLKVVPGSIDQAALPWATRVCDKAETLLMVCAKLKPYLDLDYFPTRVLPQPETTPIARYTNVLVIYWIVFHMANWSNYGDQSKYIQQIMESCPLLLVLCAGHLSIRDMRQGRPWVCHRLQSLTLRFDMEEDKELIQANQDSVDLSQPSTTEIQWGYSSVSQHYIFNRLSELVHLEDLTSLPVFTSESKTIRNLQFRLQFGMDALSSLVRLKTLNVACTKQRMDLDDIEWMIQNWKHLRTIEGGLTGNRTEDTILETVLRAHNISLIL